MSGQLWFTQRSVVGHWDQLWVNPTETADNNPGPFTDVSCVFNNNAPDIIGISAGGLWLIRSDAQGNWPHFDEIQRHERNNPGDFQVVSSASEFSGVPQAIDTLQVVGIAGNRLRHTIDSDKGWAPVFGDIAAQEATDRSPFSDVGCAIVSGNDLQVVGLANGRLWHTIRFDDGHWEPDFGLVENQAQNNPGPFSAISCAWVGQDLHLVGIVFGFLWHTIRFANGRWQTLFGLIERQVAGPSHSFTSISCTGGLVGELHVVGIASVAGRGDRLWHTIRFPDGNWQASFGDILDQQQTHPSSPFTDISCSYDRNHDRLQLAGIA